MSPRRCRTGLARALVALSLWIGAGAVSARAADTSNVLVVEDDGAILAPPDPLPLANHRLTFSPRPEGGYASTVEAVARGADAAWSRGRRLEAGDATGATRLSLDAPVSFYGTPYREIYVHPDGLVSLGQPLAPDTRALAATAGQLLRSLSPGPPLVAALWTELRAPRDEGGVFVEESVGQISISWVGFRSARPVDGSNAFRVTFHGDGRVELEYADLATGWGLIGLSPGAEAERVSIVDLTASLDVAPRQAAFAWYRDLPALNEIAVAREVYRRLPDRVQFLAVFTNRPVDGPSLVGSFAVKNPDRGIGLPVLDDAALFGSESLEHLVVMNDLAFWDDDPSRPPRFDPYAFAPSTLAVLAHETGHRWLGGANASGAVLGNADGHWSFFLDSEGSFLGGNRLRDNQDGTFTTLGGFEVFGPLDQYLMGLRAPHEVDPFYLVEGVTAFSPQAVPSAQPFDARSKPEAGVRFRGTRRDLSIDQVVRGTGERSPHAAEAPRSFRMAFVLVVPRGVQPTSGELAKLDRIRRSFSLFFEQATGGRARLSTTLPLAPAGPPEAPHDDPALVVGAPRILDAEVRPRSRGRVAVRISFADFDADLTSVELSTDVTQGLPPATIDVTPAAYGDRRGSLTLTLRAIAPSAREVRLTLVDGQGRRSTGIARRLPEPSSNE